MTSLKFDNLHPQILNRLRTLYESGKLPTSLLFAGRKGVGKWIIAEQLTRDLVCLESPRKPDCRCAACRQVSNFSHPDVNYLLPLPADDKEWSLLTDQYLHARREDPFADTTATATQYIPLDSVRHFQTHLSRKASLSPVKVGIVSEAERMLPATMDSLLKILEEPPENTHLILLTDKPGLLLPTILSRLQRVNFPVLSSGFVEEYLRKNYELGEEKVTALARLANGSLNGIAALAEEDIFSHRDVCWKIFSDAFESTAANFVVKHGENAQLTSRDSVEQACRHWQMFLRDAVLLNASSDREGIGAQLFYPDLQSAYDALLHRITNSHKLFDYLEKLETTLQELRRNVNPRFAAMNFLTEIADSAKTPAPR